MPNTDLTTQIEALRQFPSQLQTLVANQSSTQLTTAYVAGEWTIAQNVHHLADSHMHSYIRCKFIAASDNPTLQPYDQDRWAIFADAQAADISTSLALLQGLHQRWADFFAALPAEAFERVGFHPENGAMSLRRILLNYVKHGEAHLAQIRAVIAAQG